jgi:hypothetical protein
VIGRAVSIVLVASIAGADPLPDAPAFCEVTPCLPGRAHRRMLAHDEKIAGVVCKHGSEVGTDDNGKLMYCTTAAAQTLDGLPVAGDAYSLFHPSGRVYQTHLAKPHEFALADATTMGCAADVVAIAPDGTLAWCVLRGTRGNARSGKGIALFPSGKVKAETLDVATAFGRLNVPAGTGVWWDDAGIARGGTLAVAIAIGALKIRGDFTLHDSGAVHELELAEAARVHSHDFPVEAHLELRPDGTLAAARWVSASGFMIHGEPWTDTTSATYDAAGRTTSSMTDHWQSDVRPP